ncbi:MAG TPA: hypothetical protein VG324_02505, partial [Blastocatellia bacterium]|nr:hypothetical protein [Blastocatellia bacterium]
DGGRPSEAGLQEQASNSRKLRWSRAIVVSVTGKGVINMRIMFGSYPPVVERPRFLAIRSNR